MTDKEVGKLWEYREDWGIEVEQLIRKLVEERVRASFSYTGENRPQYERRLKQALRDFGIDPETFK